MKGTINDNFLDQLRNISGKKRTVNDIGLPDLSGSNVDKQDDDIDETVMMGAETLVIAQNKNTATIPSLPPKDQIPKTKIKIPSQKDP